MKKLTFISLVLLGGGLLSLASAAAPEFSKQLSYSPDKLRYCEWGVYFARQDWDQTHHECRTPSEIRRNDQYTLIPARVPEWEFVGLYFRAQTEPVSDMPFSPEARNYFNRRGWEISLELNAPDNSAPLDAWFRFYDFVNIPEDWEYLLSAGADDFFQWTIDGEEKSSFIRARGSDSSHRTTYFKPVFLTKGEHLMELGYYNWTAVGGVAGEIIGPFPKGSLLNPDGTSKDAAALAAAIEGDPKVLVDQVQSRSNNTFRAPEPWANKRIWSSNQILKTPDQMIALTPERPGYYCDKGETPGFIRDQAGKYQRVPVCYDEVQPAKPNPDLTITQTGTINLANVKAKTIAGTCHSTLGQAHITVENQAFELDCINNQRTLTSDFSAFPEGKLLVSGKQVFEKDGQTYTSQGVNDQLFKDTIPPVIAGETKLTLKSSANLPALTFQITDENALADWTMGEIAGLEMKKDKKSDQLWTIALQWKAPKQAGNYPFTITATDAFGNRAEHTFTLTVEKRRSPNNEDPTSAVVPTPQPTNPDPKPLPQPTPPSVKPAEEEIFNPTVENGKCYTRRTFLGIKDSTKIITSEEFKKALSFLWTYEMTMYDSVDGYDPYRNLSRQEAAKIFSQFAMNVLCRKPDKNLKINYSDVANADPTLKPYITLAYQLGVMKGSGMGDGLFRPFDHISKAEVNAVLIRMILKSYLEEKGELWYANYNKVSESLKITQRWAGLEALSRNDLALMLFRAYKEQEFEWREIGYFSFVLKLRDLFVK